MIACENCFGDLYIKDLICGAQTKVTCALCGSEEVSTKDLTTLERFSETLFTYYKTSEQDQGKTFVDCLKSDWGLFPKLDYSNSLKLMKALFPDFIFEDKFYVKESNEPVHEEDNWEHLKNELICENRFFPKNQKTLTKLDQIFPTLIFKDHIERFYRSRISTTPLTVDKMGKPPSDISTAGRANPIGIPYLYLASDIETSIAEVRPQKKDIVYIAEFSQKEPLTLLDLRNPIQRASPFELAALEISSKEVHRNIHYLVGLGKELSKPINSSRAHLEYIPTQFLCEFVKHSKQGFDGVVYQSSVGDGFNIAIFNDHKVNATGNIFTRTVESIKYDISND